MKREKGFARALAVTLILTGMLVFVLGCGTLALAQQYPTRSIDMIISMAPGASNDIGGRLIAKGAEKYLGKEIIPINKPGGGGAVAAGLVANSKPDGYTILATVSATLTNTPHMENVTYKPLQDFIPIFQYGYLVPAFLVRADSPYKTMKDIVEAARKNPGKISFGVPGAGTSPDIAAQLIAEKEKVDFAIVPMGGSAPSIAALLGGHVTVAGVSAPAAVPQVSSGKARGLATTSGKRDPALPTTATLAEQGYPDIVLEEVYMIAAPKGTPKPIVDKLENAFRKTWAEGEEYRKTSKTMFMYPANPLSGAKLGEWLKDQYEVNGRIIKKGNIGK